MANELPGQTLQPTALVHEAWLRLVVAEQQTWQTLWRRQSALMPGRACEAFIASQLAKIAAIRERIDASGRDIRLEVDGGVDAITAPQVIAAGADVLVAGSASFRGGPDLYAANIAGLRGA